MPEGDFKKAIMDAIAKRAGKGGLSADFASRVNKHWDEFTAANPTDAVAPQKDAPKQEAPKQ